MKSSIITIINENRNILDIDLYFRLNQLFTRNFIDEKQQKQIFTFRDGCVIEIKHNNNKCKIKCYFDFKYTEKGRYMRLCQRKQEEYISKKTDSQ